MGAGADVSRGGPGVAPACFDGESLEVVLPAAIVLRRPVFSKEGVQVAGGVRCGRSFPETVLVGMVLCADCGLVLGEFPGNGGALPGWTRGVFCKVPGQQEC